MKKDHQTGFTLIELSIVLVIIGLIVGGVLVGQDLMKAAQLRHVMKQIEELQTASATFKVKYNSMPGDIPNAGDFWPLKISGSTYACWVQNPGGSMTLTCNGDGNGHIDPYESVFLPTICPWPVWCRGSTATTMVGRDGRQSTTRTTIHP